MLSAWPIRWPAPRLQCPWQEQPDAKDEQRVQDDVAHTAHDEGCHGHFHPAHGLEDLLKSQGGHVDRGKAKHDVGIGQAHGEHFGIRCKAPQKDGMMAMAMAEARGCRAAGKTPCRG